MSGNGYAGDYAGMAAEIVAQALAAGATDAECTISEGDEFSASVRMRELEKLKEAGRGPPGCASWWAGSAVLHSPRIFRAKASSG